MGFLADNTDETQCGAHLILIDKKGVEHDLQDSTDIDLSTVESIRIHTIVEGSDAEYSFKVPNNSTLEYFQGVVENAEYFADEAFEEANREFSDIDD